MCCLQLQRLQVQQSVGDECNMKSRALHVVCCVLSIILSTVTWSVLGNTQLELFTRFMCDNSPVCFAGQPSESIYDVTSDKECVLACQRKKTQPEYCVGFNYRKEENACDMFNSSSNTLNQCHFRKNSAGCQFIQVCEISLEIVTYF